MLHRLSATAIAAAIAIMISRSHATSDITPLSQVRSEVALRASAATTTCDAPFFLREHPPGRRARHLFGPGPHVVPLATRPKMRGGPVVPPIKACKTFSAPGSASAVRECTLDLPRSFAGGDGLRVQTNGKGGSKDAALVLLVVVVVFRSPFYRSSLSVQQRWWYLFGLSPSPRPCENIDSEIDNKFDSEIDSEIDDRS